MSAIRYRTKLKGGLPHLSFIFRKPELLGTDFKTVALSVTGSLLLLDIHMGKKVMKSSQYHLELGATAACTNILVEETKRPSSPGPFVSSTNILVHTSVLWI